MTRSPKFAAGANSLSPYIVVKDARSAIAFYRDAFAAEELFRLVDPVSGRIGHAELRIGEAILMLSDEYPDFGAYAPDHFGGSPMKFHLDVTNAKATVDRAVAAGAMQLRELKQEFHGCRQALLADPHGFCWFISEKVEDVTPEMMQERWNTMTGAG